MAYHEFGIMENCPIKYQRLDKYEPEKFKLIKIGDDFIEPLLQKFEDIPCYWHSLTCQRKNLAYCGITLIPPGSIDSFISIFSKYDNESYNEVIALLEKAKTKGKYVIHYGI